MYDQEFLFGKITKGILSDLKAELEGIKDDIQDAKDLLADLEFEEVLLQLIVDYTEMLQEGWDNNKKNATLELIKIACDPKGWVKGTEELKKKIAKFKGEAIPDYKIKHPVDEKLQISYSDIEAMEGQVDQQHKEYQEKVHQTNKRLIELARWNQAKELDEFCQTINLNYKDIASFAAWTEAYAKDAKDALAVLENYFDELIPLKEGKIKLEKYKAEEAAKEEKEGTPQEDEKPEEVEQTSPNDDLNWEYEEDKPDSELKAKLALFTDVQVHQAAMDAARIWAKTSSDRGKFSLRLFINMLENLIGPEADIDTEVAEYALNKCKSVSHVSGDIWMEVN